MIGTDGKERIMKTRTEDDDDDDDDDKEVSWNNIIVDKFFVLHRNIWNHFIAINPRSTLSQSGSLC